MRSGYCVLTVGLLSALLPISLAAQGLPQARPGPPWVPGEIVVGFSGDSAAAARDGVAAALNATPGRRIPQIGAQVFHVPAADAVQSVAQRALGLPGVRYAEPNYRRRVFLAAPNDPAYSNIDTSIAYWDEGTPTYFQWTLHQIEALGAWGIYPNTYYTQGTKPTNPPKIAVLDTGIDCGIDFDPLSPDGDTNPHLDFVNSGGTSPAALAGGQIDMVNGRNVISGAPDPTNFADDFGHGTAVASVAVASANNGATHGSGGGYGIAGIAYNGQVLPVKVFDNTGNGTEADLAAAIIYAVDHGAVVINISGGDYYYSQVEQDAVDYAWTHGSLILAACGNEGDGANRPMYPAALDGVMAVAATVWEPPDYPASYSNYGYYVSIGAPAGDISLVPLGFWGTWCAMPTEPVPLHDAGWEPYVWPYQYHFGTSLSSPLAAGLALLYASYKGITQSTPNAPLLIWKALCRGCDPILGTAGWNPHLGWGRINAYHTLLEDNNRGSTVGGVRGQVRYKGTVVGNATVSAVPDGGGAPTDATSHINDGMYNIAGLSPGVYDVTATYFGESRTRENVVVESGYDIPRVSFDIAGSVANVPPVLSWTGQTGFISDGVDPDIAEDPTRGAFRVRYADADGDAPSGDVAVHILRNGTELPGSPFAMTTGVVTDWSAGAVFRTSQKLSWGDYSYYFEAGDGTSAATGQPTNEQDGPEIITPPELANPRVVPTRGDATTAFRYWVDYSSVDGKPATWVELQVKAYDPIAGWDRDTWRKRNIAGGTSVLWKLRIADFWPDATRFRYRFRALKGTFPCRLLCETDWTTGPWVTGGGMAALAVSSLSAAPTRSGGVQITFALSAPGDVEATVLNVAGRPVRAIHQAGGDQGLNTMLWDGRSSAGLAVPNGTYLVRLTARAARGGEATALTSVRLDR